MDSQHFQDVSPSKRWNDTDSYGWFMSVSDYISAHWKKCLSWKNQSLLFRQDLKFGEGEIRAQVSEGNRKVFCSVNCHFSHFFPFYYTGALFISVSFPTGTLSFSSEMDPRCRRCNNNSKCFTLLNGVDVNATAWNLKGCAQLSGLVSLPAQRKKKKKKTICVWINIEELLNKKIQIQLSCWDLNYSLNRFLQYL